MLLNMFLDSYFRIEIFNKKLIPPRPPPHGLISMSVSNICYQKYEFHWNAQTNLL